MRVKEDYYDNLKRITDKFGERELLPVREVANFLGCDYRTLFRKNGPGIKQIGGRYFVTVVALARWMS